MNNTYTANTSMLWASQTTTKKIQYATHHTGHIASVGWRPSLGDSRVVATNSGEYMLTSSQFHIFLSSHSPISNKEQGMKK
ncbi:MAG: hypothetical protein JST02_02145 [Bacteroidetes bacterium]|nr:hypothetical protein [Bacteroidota bacterium]